MRDAAVGFHCPECVAAAWPTATVLHHLQGERGLVTKTLIGINVLLLVVAAVTAGANAADSLAGDATTPLHAWGGVIGRSGDDTGPAIGLAAGEYWRLFTATFLHFGALHLGLNTVLLWELGQYLERLLGPSRFLALYLTSGIAGGVAEYVSQPPGSITVGASGAAFGVVAALVVINYRLGVTAGSGLLAVLIVINLPTAFFVPHISLAGYLGGLATGGLVAFGFAYGSGEVDPGAPAG
jgi:membrane associated rhomboid family serine protease